MKPSRKILIASFVSLAMGYSLGSRRGSETVKIIEKQTTVEINSCWEQYDDLKEKCEVKTAKVETSPAASPAVSEEINAKAIPTPGAASFVQLPPKEKRPWTKLGAKAAEIGFEADVKEFLKQIEIPDFFSELKSSGPIADDQLSNINGHFVGSISFDESNKEPWQMEMDFNGQMRDGEVRGSELITLTKSGKVISRTTGRGKVKTVSSFSGDSNSIIINAYGDDGYVQLYYFPKLDIFSGIYYDKVRAGDFRKAGIVTLAKR